MDDIIHRAKRKRLTDRPVNVRLGMVSCFKLLDRLPSTLSEYKQAEVRGKTAYRYVVFPGIVLKSEGNSLNAPLPSGAASSMSWEHGPATVFVVGVNMSGRWERGG